MRLTESFSFSAAHVYQRSGWSQEENWQHFGPCTRVHGHDYQLRITFSSQQPWNAELLAQIRQLLKEQFSCWDHQFLNAEHPDLKGRIPTCEGLALSAFDKISPKLPQSLKLCRIEVQEGQQLTAILSF